MSKVINEVRQKLGNGQNLFRRSTIEKMLAEYDRLLMRNTALEKNAAEQSVHPTLLTHCPNDGRLLLMGFCDQCKTQYPHIG